MRRRAVLILALTLSLLAAPLAARAQQTGRIAFLCPSSCSTLPNAVGAQDQAFLKGLERGGYPDARGVSFDMAGAGVGFERLSEMATRLVARKADVIVALGGEAARAASRATKTVPIVMLGVADPVEEGLIASLGRPGGNITGLAVPSAQLAAKQVELLREMQPRLARVAVLWNPRSEQSKLRLERVEAAVRRLGVQVHPVGAVFTQDLEKAFASMTHARVDGMLLLEPTPEARGEIAQFALKRRVPSVASQRAFVEAGGLMAYGPDVADGFERAAVYAAKVLRGAKHSELPVEEPTRFALIVSKVTAQALGLTIPQSLLLRADQVIQ